MANQNRPNRPNQNSSGTATKPEDRRANQPMVPGTTNAAKLTSRQQAARRRAQQRQRTQLIITSVIILVIVVAAIIIGISVTQPNNFQNLPATASKDTGRQQLGPNDAKVTVEEYGDFQCPVCKAWFDNNQPKFMGDYITAGKSVKLIFRDFPFLDSGHSQRESHIEAAAAYCAADQNRFWDFHDSLYTNQKPENSGYWNAGRLKDLGKALNLDTNAFSSCVDSNKYNAQTNQDATDADAKGVTGTPTFAINGTLVNLSDPNDYATLKQDIDAALNGTATPGTTTP